MAFEMTAYRRMMRSAIQNTGQTSLQMDELSLRHRFSDSYSVP